MMDHDVGIFGTRILTLLLVLEMYGRPFLILFEPFANWISRILDL
jgi:hypothetical protein